MKTIKKILFPIFSIFLAYRSIELMRNLMASNPVETGLKESVIISFLLTLYITGVFAFMGFAYPTSRILPTSFYKIRNSKLLNIIYKVLGIKYFRILLLVVFWGRKNNRKKYFDGTKNGLKDLEFQTRQSEFGHFTALLTILILSVILLMQGYYVLAILMTLINVIGNLFPIILQRKHRSRIEKIAKRYPL